MTTAAAGAFHAADHLPALQIIGTLLAAPVCSLLRGRLLPWLLTMVMSVVALGVSLALLQQVLAHGPVDYHLGNWAPPVGIAFRADTVNAFVLVIVAAMSTVVLPFAKRSVEAEVPAESHPLFYTSYLLCLTGLLGLTITGDAFNFFVFLEISSLSTYTLIAMGSQRDRRALTASFSYLVMGTIGATFFVIGLGFLYMMTGTLNMVDLAERLADQRQTTAFPVAFAFITVGLGLKAAMFPLHAWLPNAYTFAPSAVTTFLAATATKTAIYALMRFLFTVFGFEFGFEADIMPFVLAPLALAAMFIGSAIAVWQQDLKRMLAWSSIAQLGYMLLGISIARLSADGLTGSIVHLFNHALMKAACFMALGAFMYRVGTTSITGLTGIGRKMPWTMGAFVVGGLSLIGVPGTVGFVSKWYLVKGALSAGLWPLAILIMLSSLLAVVYVWRVVEAAYFKDAVRARIGTREAPLSMLVPMWVLALACIWFGLDATLTADVAATAAAELLRGVQ